MLYAIFIILIGVVLYYCAKARSISSDICPKAKYNITQTKIITTEVHYGNTLKSTTIEAKFKLYGMWWYVRWYHFDGEQSSTGKKSFDSITDAQKYLKTFTAGKYTKVSEISLLA